MRSAPLSGSAAETDREIHTLRATDATIHHADLASPASL
jgi:hypothetical protein